MRHRLLGGVQVRSACALACRLTRSGARRLPVSLAAEGGAGYRDKFFVKVYAAAFYVDYTLGIDTEQWKQKIGIESFDSNSVFDSIFKAPVVKSLSIILVRDVDGKTFVNALNDVIARQIKNPNAEEESSLSTFQNTFLGRNLKQGTSIYLTWLEPSRMLISISENQDPSQVDAEIKSATVNYALYDGFFGNSPVSPSLRSSTAQLLEALLTK
ncbi:Fatty-acid-binding protein 3, chloroplastic [Dichanthelium oligosanthes]|uniref:Chalcone-flavonone isomerase family protein n=1 Tax=Dichanthelium oligosanthes TaxID=888268 RepID=A0A1E5UYT4_9POAL|nr:Fatty-acid-binding protein 3, chloroplastic [Dichanthelium oligosanthes]